MAGAEHDHDDDHDDDHDESHADAGEEPTPELAA
jgi:hypothetical protein